MAMIILLGILATPTTGTSEELEVGGLMNRMKEAYSEVVRLLLMFPVEESGDEAPFAVVGKNLEKIVQTAQQLRLLKNYKNDKSFQSFSVKLEKQALHFAGVIKKRNQMKSVAGVASLQNACLQCHKNHRF